MREQRGITTNTFKRRASLPPDEREYTASRHAVGTRSGMHPADYPYITTTRSRSHAPTTETYVEIDEEGEEVFTGPPTRSSARRYDLTPMHRGQSDGLKRYPARENIRYCISVSSWSYSSHFSPPTRSFHQRFRNGAMIGRTAFRAPIKPMPMSDMADWSILSP